MTEVKKVDFEALRDAELEERAKNLDWPPRSGYGYGSRQNLLRFKIAGYPAKYKQKKMFCRREFLIARLKASPKNALSDAEKAEAKKKEVERKKKEREEALTKSWVSKDINVSTVLQEPKEKGQSFKLTRNQDSKGSYVSVQTGPNNPNRLCSFMFEFGIEACREVATLIHATKESPIKAKSDSIKVSMFLYVRGPGDYRERLSLDWDEHFITVGTRNNNNNRESYMFKKDDFVTALQAATHNYTVKEELIDVESNN